MKKGIKLFLVLIIICSVPQVQGQANKSDSLWQVYKQTKKDTVRIQLLLDLGDIFMSKTPDSSLYFYYKALAITDISLASHRSDHYDHNDHQYNLFSLKAKSLLNIGIVIENSGSYNIASENYLMALKIYKKLRDKKGMATCYNSLGISHYYQGDYSIAMKNFLKSLKIYEESGNIQRMASCYINIGAVHNRQGNYEKALDNYQKALSIYKESNYIRETAICYNNIGEIYRFYKDYDKAMDIFFRSLDIFVELDGKREMAKCYMNIGLVNEGLGSYDKANKNYLKSLKIRKELGDKEGVAINYSNMSSLFITMADSSETPGTREWTNLLNTALDYANKAYDLAIEIGVLLTQKDAASNLREAYTKLGMYKKAIKYAEIFITAKDSMFSEEKTKALAEMTSKYEAEKKQLQIDKMEKQKQLDDKTIEAHQAKNHKQQIIIFSAVGGFMVVLVIAFLILYLFRQKKTANILLSEQKEEIETQAKELEIQNIELEKLSIVASETDNAIVILSADGNIEWVNNAFTSLYGYSLKEFIKQNGKNIIEASSNLRIKKIIKKAIFEKKPINYITNTTKKSGSKIWVQTTLTPIIGEKGEISKIVSIDTDITEIKSAEKRINEQKEQIEGQNRNITDSIIYAQHIQRALLPPGDYMKQLLPHRFIFYKPRDIVSGDFYWVNRKEGLIITVAADCTGHGVPGAMLSMLGVSILNEIVNTIKKPDAGKILNDFRDKLIESLHQGGKESHMWDGIDIALCLIDLTKESVQYAGAYSPLYLIRDGNLKVFKGNKMPIGFHARMESFSSHNIKVQSGDMLYIFSDGYADQFGGEDDKRFTQRRFKKLLQNIHNKPMTEQKEELEKTLVEWQGKSNQIDDILVMGIRI